MGTTSDKLTYLGETKSKIKDSINLTGANIGANDTFRSYATKLKQGYLDIINNGTDTLYDNMPKVSGIGTNLSLTPTYEAPIKINEIDGDTLQDGTPTPNAPVEIQSVTGLQNVEVCGKNLYNSSYRNENNQIDFVRCTGSEANGIYTMTATNRDMYFWYVVSSGNSYTSASGPLFEFTEDTYSMTMTNSLFTNNYVTYYDKNKISLGYVSKSSNQFTINKNDKTGAKYFSIRIGYGQATVGETYETSVQLEQGSTATEYEPYKGNTYEVNLGKNLLKNTLLLTERTVSGITATPNSDGSIKLNGTANADVYINLAQIDFGNTTFNSNTGGSNKYVASLGIVSSSTRLAYSGNNKYSYIVIWQGTVLNNVIVYPMIEKGSKVTSYSPYFTPIELNKTNDNVYQDSIKKSTGKNLFDLDKALLNKTLTTTGAYYDEENAIASDYIQVQPNTAYTYVDYSNVGNYMKLCEYDSNKNFIVRSIMINGTNSTITTSSTTKYITIAKSGYNATTSKLSLEKSSNPTSYEPYGKVWYIEKQTGKYNIDTSQITLRDTYTNVEYAQIPKASDYIGYNAWGSQTYLCSHAQWSANALNWDSVDNIGKIYSGAQSYNWWIGFAKGTGLDAIKTALTGSYIVYPLSTPTYTEITNTELIEDLETLNTAKSQEGTTNISITSEDLEMILNVSALKGDVE